MRTKEESFPGHHCTREDWDLVSGKGFANNLTRASLSPQSLPTGQAGRRGKGLTQRSKQMLYVSGNGRASVEAPHTPASSEGCLRY